MNPQATSAGGGRAQTTPEMELLLGQKEVLESIVAGAPLEKSLSKLMLTLESQMPGTLCSVLLLDPDGVHLRTGAAPSLPADYNAAIDGLSIGPRVGSCGTAAHGRRMVVVEDIATDPLWADFKPLALAHGLRACWSTPIFDAKQNVLGTFAIYSRQPGRPVDLHFRLMSAATQSAALAIQRKRAEEQMRNLNETLEQRVAERTAELALANEGLQTEVAERKRSETALEHERFLLQTLMDNLPDRIYFKDRQSRFLRNSRAHLERFGLTSQEPALGKTDQDFFATEHAQQAYEDEQQVIRLGQPFTKEEKETWPDGSVTWALSTKMPMRDEQGEIVGTFGISRDITARRRAEDALRVAKEAAEEASRTKSQFLASMSHELRTPLNSVIGFANILAKNKSGNLSPNELTFLERIIANGKHLLSLINEILDLSKIEARKIELQIAPVALDALVRETVAQQESLVRDKPVELLAEVPAVVAPFETDAEKLRQVIINLIGNALKFTEQGSVTVRVATDPRDHHPVRIDVQDTGIGIPRDKLGIIFEAFQQAEAGTARKYGGTGLGLTISQALCQLMGYHITVASEPGRGSTFSVMLKPTPEIPSGVTTFATRREDAPSAAASPAALPGRRVLVIDDEADSRLLLAHLIGDCGCQVISASSGAQGLQLAREFHPDLITLDLMMPSMDGWQVLHAIKADRELSHIPVVVVSVVGGENRGRIFGALDVLQKPLSREDLLAVLQRNLQVARPRILVVDDDADARRILAAALQDQPVEFRDAANGQEALAMLGDFLPDLILLDLMMPVMDGISFLDALRRDPRHQRLPVVVITAKELTPAEIERFKLDKLRVLKKADAFDGALRQLLEELLPDSAPPPPSKADESRPQMTT